jgi:FkbM family methyltransferase
MSEQNPITKHADLIYDVGMHKGEDTDYYLKKGFRVVAFEADPGLAADCRARFAEAIADQRLTLVEGAIVDPDTHGSEPTIKFYRNLDYSVWGTVNPDWASRNENLRTRNEIIEVRAIRFSECLREYGIPYYMKIDIEGVDTVCLKALQEFEARPDYVSIESEKVDFNKLRGEFGLLERLGYDSYKLVQQVTIPRQQEPADSREGRGSIGYRFQAGASGLFGKDIPGSWASQSLALLRYRGIFILYKLLGDAGIVNRCKYGRRFRWALEKKLGRHIPGWYDTHARHASAR